MWRMEHDLSDELRQPLLAYRRRRLCYGMLGIFLSFVALVSLVEHTLYYLAGNSTLAAASWQLSLSIIVLLSGAFQAYRYWHWRRHL